MICSGDLAGKAYLKVADCHLKVTSFAYGHMYWTIVCYDNIAVYVQSDSKHDAANAYAEAAKCYKKVDTNGMYRSNLLYHLLQLTVSVI